MGATELVFHLKEFAFIVLIIKFVHAFDNIIYCLHLTTPKYNPLLVVKKLKEPHFCIIINFKSTLLLRCLHV